MPDKYNYDIINKILPVNCEAYLKNKSCHQLFQQVINFKKNSIMHEKIFKLSSYDLPSISIISHVNL